MEEHEGSVRRSVFVHGPGALLGSYGVWPELSRPGLFFGVSACCPLVRAVGCVRGLARTLRPLRGDYLFVSATASLT